MVVEIKQLSVKGTLTEEPDRPRQEPPPVSQPKVSVEECVEAESRRVWREEQRQKDER